MNEVNIYSNNGAHSVNVSRSMVYYSAFCCHSFCRSHAVHTHTIFFIIGRCVHNMHTKIVSFSHTSGKSYVRRQTSNIAKIRAQQNEPHFRKQKNARPRRNSETTKYIVERTLKNKCVTKLSSYPL